MTTATAPQAQLTEAAIRAVFAEQRETFEQMDRSLADAVQEWADAIAYVELDDEGRHDFGERFISELWADLRPPEQARLGEIVLAAKESAIAGAREVIESVMVTAALAFAAEYPEAPRLAR